MSKLIYVGMLCVLSLHALCAAPTNAFDREMETNRRALLKQLQLAQQAGNDKLVQNLREALGSLEKYKPADGDMNAGVSFLVAPATGHYCRLPTSALIITPQATQVYPGTVTNSTPAGTPIPFPQMARELRDIVCLQYVSFEKDQRGFVLPMVSKAAIDGLKSKQPPRIIVFVEETTGEAIGGVGLK